MSTSSLFGTSLNQKSTSEQATQQQAMLQHQQGQNRQMFGFNTPQQQQQWIAGQDIRLTQTDAGPAGFTANWFRQKYTQDREELVKLLITWKRRLSDVLDSTAPPDKIS